MSVRNRSVDWLIDSSIIEPATHSLLATSCSSWHAVLKHRVLLLAPRFIFIFFPRRLFFVVFSFRFSRRK